MAGVRLHHPDLRGCIHTVVHAGQRLRTDYDCPMCGIVHQFKTYHLALDEVGDVVVNERIYAGLIEAGLHPLTATREVRKPEMQHLPLPMIGSRVPDRRFAGTNGRPIRPGKELVIAREGRHR